jgi:hypothetical protein
MQPCRPQGHLWPPIITHTWPISAAAPRPSQERPFRMIPPPTPVPQKTPSSDRYSRPEPSANSASVATLTSLSIFTREVPSASFSDLPSANEPSQAGRLRALDTTPRRASMTPGEPTPTPSSSFVATPACSAEARTDSAIASATSWGPPLCGVGRRSCPWTSPSSSITTAWILVPPRSMPARMGAA